MFGAPGRLLLFTSVAAGGGGVQQLGDRPSRLHLLVGGLAAELAHQFPANPGGVILDHPQQQRVLALGGQSADPGGQSLSIVLYRLRWSAGLGGGREQVLVQAQEVGQSPLRRAERTQPRRDGRLQLVLLLVVEGVLVTLPCPVRRQPGNIEWTQIAGGEFGPDADDRRQRAFDALFPVLLLCLAGEVEDEVLAAGPGADLIAYAVAFGLLGVEHGLGEAEHDPVGAPVGQIQVGVVVTLHHAGRVPAEVAPVVLVGEAGGGDVGPGGQGTNLGLLPIGERPVDG
ncbi:hypothetical protein ACQEVF_20930 [Nonomuraea polychroma]|uniref:hypothetical protein n=1 Tax=Nonomuraea polychroma TaxID=46176 RepID=UPI003D92D193